MYNLNRDVPPPPLGRGYPRITVLYPRSTTLAAAPPVPWAGPAPLPAPPRRPAVRDLAVGGGVMIYSG